MATIPFLVQLHQLAVVAVDQEAHPLVQMVAVEEVLARPITQGRDSAPAERATTEEMHIALAIGMVQVPVVDLAA